MIGLAPALAPDSLLHQPAFMRLGDDHGIHGLIHSVNCEHRGAHRIGYSLMLVPAPADIWSSRRGAGSSCKRACRRSLRQLLEEHHLPTDSYRIEMTVGQYPPRAFCIQYEESDLTLLQRLCEEEGIHYHFEHRPTGMWWYLPMTA